MKTKYKLLALFSIGVLAFAFLSGSASGAIIDYMPDPGDVVGYDCIYNETRTLDNPFNETDPGIEMGTQIWVKNETELTAVVGATVFDLGNNTILDENIPSFIRDLLAIIDFSGNTWWDYLVFVMVNSTHVTDITDTIGTTETSLEVNLTGGDYIIVSKDQNFIILTFSFTISNDWATMLEAAIDTAFEAQIALVEGLLGLFFLYVDYIGGIFIQPSDMGDGPAYQMPSGDPTAGGDVQNVTTQFGALFVGSGGGIPGYPALIVAGATGFAVLFVAFKKSKKIAV